MKAKFVRLGCGLDIDKNYFHACFGGLDVAGSFKVRAQKKFVNGAKGIKEFIHWLKQQVAKVDPSAELPFQLVMETTGVYHEAVLFAAHQAGLPVCLEVAKRVKRYLQSIGQYSKNDKLDASGIARMASERQLRPWKPCSEQVYALRAALRQRKALIDSKVAFQNQLHAAEHSQVTGRVVKSSIQRLIKQVEREIAKLEDHIEQLYQHDEVLQARLAPIIDSITGLGLITALTIVAETNGFDQITSRKQLASYAGYDVVENSSGTTQRKTRISKQGNARIRRELYMAAACIIRLKVGSLYQLYERVRRRNPKAYKIANVAVQRKLLLLVYTLYKKQQRFDPNYQHQQPNKQAQETKTSSAGPSPALHEIEDTMVALPLEG